VNNIETHCICVGRRHNEMYWNLLIIGGKAGKCKKE
jgi:hypothetical protein